MTGIMENMVPVCMGAMLMTGLLWATLFFFGRRLMLHEKDQVKRPAVAIRWWTGTLALWLALGFVFDEVSQALASTNPEAGSLAALWIQYHFIFFNMVTLPLSALIMVQLVTTKHLSRTRILANIVPFVVLCGLGFAIQRDWYFYTLMMLMAGFVVAMIIYIIVRGVRYEQELKNFYSSIFGRSIYWMVAVLVMLTMLLFNYTAYFLFQHAITWILYFPISIFLWNFIFMRVYRMVIIKEYSNALMENEPEDEPENEAIESPEDSGISREEQFKLDLVRICEEEELYLRDDLTRDVLAEKMNMKHSKFSKLLNDTIGMTFYDYINGLRVKKSEQLLAENQMDVGSIAQAVGFNSRSTFYRAFAAVHGCTPMEYVNKY